MCGRLYLNHFRQVGRVTEQVRIDRPGSPGAGTRGRGIGNWYYYGTRSRSSRVLLGTVGKSHLTQPANPRPALVLPVPGCAIMQLCVDTL
eukprot:COSAG02_NODE_3060_length_7449_cov_6.145578_4_plen_90_part_00